MELFLIVTKPFEKSINAFLLVLLFAVNCFYFNHVLFFALFILLQTF